MTKTTMRIAVWTGAAVLTAAVATAAVAATLSGGDRVLTPDEVAAQLAADDSVGDPTAEPFGDPTAGPTDEPTDDPTPDLSEAVGPARVVKAPGGTLVVVCAGDVATLSSWTPNDGYRADDPVRGPASRVYLEFESDTYDDNEVTVTCMNGVPVSKVFVEPDDHGGDDDNSGRGGGGSNSGGGSNDD